MPKDYEPKVPHCDRCRVIFSVDGVDGIDFYRIWRHNLQHRLKATALLCPKCFDLAFPPPDTPTPE